MSDPLPVAALIDRCLPGDEHRELAVALMRIGHAAQTTDVQTGLLGAAMAEYLQNPADPESRAALWHLLIESDSLAQELTVLAQEIRKSRAVLRREIGLRTA